MKVNREIFDEIDTPIPTHTKIEIVKVQVPLNVAAATWCMIYDKDRKRATEQGVSRAARRALKGDPKGYFEAQWNAKRGYWTLGRRVKDQSW